MTYTNLVMNIYLQLKEKNILPLNLKNPTRSNIREEIINIVKRNNIIKDKKILTDFFGEYVDKKSLIKSIEKKELDFFVTLVNFLKGKTSKPDHKVVELVALLINLQPRPNFYNYPSAQVEIELLQKMKLNEYTFYDNEIEATLNIIDLDNEDQKIRIDKPISIITDSVSVYTKSNDIITQNKLENNSNKHAVNFYSVSKWGIPSMVIAILSFLGTQNNSDLISSNYFKTDLTNKCMYWDEYKYTLIGCHEKKYNTVIIAADDIIIENFKKITKKDTISNKSIGVVYYSKRNNIVEFFTGPGKHPVHSNVNLKPLTKWIYDVHVRGKK